MKPNARGRLALPELQLEMGILEEWCRFWYQSKLLPLPGDLLQHVEQAQFRAEEARLHAEQEKLRAEMLDRELEQLRAKLRQIHSK